MSNIQFVTTAEPDTRRHRALSTQSRVDLLAAVRAAGHPLTVTEAAAQVGLHPNTARVHLEHLVEVGLVARHREDRVQPGRPRTLYGVVVQGEGTASPGAGRGRADYKTLASLLARELAATPDAGRAAIEAGHRWARAQNERTRPPVTTPEDAVAVVVDLMDELGFRPEHDADAGEILLHRCPFEEVARESRSVVCGVHLGLLEGTFSQLDGGVVVEGLDPFWEDDPPLCVVRLRVATSGPGGQAAPPERGAAEASASSLSSDLSSAADVGAGWANSWDDLRKRVFGR